MSRSGPVMMSSLKWSHDVPRDSSSSCLKLRTSFRRLTTLEMGNKHKQNLEHSISQSLCILPTVWLYQCLALPIKENRNNYHLIVLSDMPAICKHAQVCSNSCRCKCLHKNLEEELQGFRSSQKSCHHQGISCVEIGTSWFRCTRVGFLQIAPANDDRGYDRRWDETYWTLQKRKD